MCGICGRLDNCGGTQSPLATMLRAMEPRGPDDSGESEIQMRNGGRLFLGACRLAILDLSPAGHQPMYDSETGNWLAFNGEIFNFREVRAELETHGCRFRSNCDTEVLLLGYRLWGEGVLERLRGFFAFAIWDESQQTLLLARDRLGIKPLYYAEISRGLLFASELRAVLASGSVAREIDPVGLDSFLKFGAVQEPGTLIRGVQLLPAAHTLRWRNGRCELRRFWSLPARAETANNDATARGRIVAEMHESLAEAVRLRLVSDVPLGIFLSGGLDSSVVTALATASGPVRTFTLTFSEKEYAEGEKARRVAAHFGTAHTEITVAQADVLAALPQALRAMDQPTVDGVNTFFVARATKQAGVTVALSGIGGDEVFAGYRSFRRVPHMQRVNRFLPAWARSLAAGVLDSNLPVDRQYRKFYAWLSQEDGFDHPFYLTRLILTPRRVARLLQPDLLLELDFSVYRAEREELDRLIAGHDSINAVSCMELSTYLRNTLLRDTDCMSMANSLEVRQPLLDHVVVEKVLRLPGAWKLAPHQAKPLLVASLKSQLPQDILAQPKHGLEFPWAVWLRHQLRTEVEETFDSPGVLGDFLRWEEVRQLWRSFLAGRVHWSRIWLFYVLRRWTAEHVAAADITQPQSVAVSAG